MSNIQQLSVKERRQQRVLVQRHKMDALPLGSEERAVEETILSVLINGESLGDFVDQLQIVSASTPGSTTA